MPRGFVGVPEGLGLTEAAAEGAPNGWWGEKLTPTEGCMKLKAAAAAAEGYLQQPITCINQSVKQILLKNLIFNQF